MISVLEQVKSLHLLLIGGAPRSGTTLLLNQLDSHPELLCFPLEHKTIENFYWNRNNIEEYAKSDFINSKKEGQQSILANSKFIDQYARRMQNIYNKEFSLNVNSDLFKKEYLYYLSIEGVTLKNILYALSYALIQSNNFAKSKLSTLKYLVFKQPFYTELFAFEVKEMIPDVKFIQVIRDPFSRYISAKTRRLKETGLKGKKLNHINRVNYVEGHVTIDIVARKLAADNLSMMGSEDYFVLSFEKLMKNSEISFRELFLKLQVDYNNSFMSPSRLGDRAMAGSIMVKTKDGQIDKSAADRINFYENATSWNERIIHKFYLNSSGVFNTKFKTPFLVQLVYLFPLKKSNWKNLMFQYLHFYKIFLRRNYKWSNFIKEAKIPSVGVGGSV